MKPEKKHKWILFDGTPVCKVCGNIKRADGKNKPCKGTVKIGLRDKP